MPNPKLLTAREYQSKKNTLKGTAGGPDPTGTRSNKKHRRNKNLPGPNPIYFLLSRGSRQRDTSQAPSRFDPRLPPPPGVRWIVWCGGVLGGDGGGGGGVQFASLNGATQLCALQWEGRGEASRKSGGPAAAVSRICPPLTLALASPKAEVVCRFNNLHTQKESEIEGREGGGLCWNGIHQSLWSSCLVLC